MTLTIVRYTHLTDQTQHHAIDRINTLIKMRAPIVCPCCGTGMVMVRTGIRPLNSPVRTGATPVSMTPVVTGAASIV